MLVHSAPAFIATLVALCLAQHVQAIQLPAIRRSLTHNDDAANLERRWFWNFGSSLGRSPDNNALIVPEDMIKKHTAALVTEWQTYLNEMHRQHPNWKRIDWRDDGPAGFARWESEKQGRSH
ncbi:uncharacterized protein SPSC_03677 [Sporisorium scitamineum]|uniref:Putative effector protein 4 n=1 Tax=Sporisorium scitamineum TaxID=49012 RepID=A0A0F7RZ99_9BASI|nr:putative effector protein 4 [Sporisorium scitamineum]CDR88091.1 uncharacterized protein SPSC_03677 [Sporisorium scitamineum]CDR99962.1 hypothetical protein [Sporisorium scitamineum]